MCLHGVAATDKCIGTHVSALLALSPRNFLSCSPRLMSTLHPRAGSQAKSTEDLQLEKVRSTPAGRLLAASVHDYCV